jgi:four helix bundle protein
MFGFQGLDVYRCAVRFLGVASSLAEQVPRGHGDLADQLRRAALSIPLNIAEGSGKGTPDHADARRFFAIARGSALECAAIVDALEVIDPQSATDAAKARELLERVVAMLSRMAKVAAGK